MDMIQLRRYLLMKKQEQQHLYPVGTDIITKYIGRNANNRALFNSGYVIDAQGTYVSGSGAASGIYIPIDPSYKYEKSANRIYNLTFYDDSMQFISSTGTKYAQLTQVEITDIPSNAAYIRFYVLNNTSQWVITLTRTA